MHAYTHIYIYTYVYIYTYIHISTYIYPYTHTHTHTCMHSIYQQLDCDDSGGLNFEEFRDGVKSLSSNVHMTRDDFDIVTENGRHLGPKNEFNREQFQVDAWKGWFMSSSPFCPSDSLCTGNDERRIVAVLAAASFQRTHAVQRANGRRRPFQIHDLGTQAHGKPHFRLRCARGEHTG